MVNRKNKTANRNKERHVKFITEKVMTCTGDVIVMEYDRRYPPKIKVMCGE